MVPVPEIAVYMYLDAVLMQGRRSPNGRVRGQIRCGAHWRGGWIIRLYRSQNTICEAWLMAESRNAEIQAQVRAVLETQPRLILGSRASHELEKDPRHFLFVLSRYKFVAKMFAGRGRLLEVGIGDGVGATLVAQTGNDIVGVDIEPYGLAEPMNTRWMREHITLATHDMVSAPYLDGGPPFDGAYSLDVIEHVPPDQEDEFLSNIVRSISTDAAVIIGTPNESAKAYASKEALAQHINWKSHDTLLEYCQQFFRHVFMFGMNDEVLHTGYAPMCHYLFALCVTPKPLVSA